MKKEYSETAYVVEPYQLLERPRLLLGVRRQAPKLEAGDLLFDYDPVSDQIQKVGKKAKDRNPADGCLRFKVQMGPQPLELRFASVDRASGHSFDVRLAGTIRIVDVTKALDGARRIWVTNELGVTVEEVWSSMEDELRYLVDDSLESADLTQFEHERPVSWWDREFLGWSQRLGFEIRIGRLGCWSSSLASEGDQRARAERERKLADLAVQVIRSRKERRKAEFAIEEQEEERDRLRKRDEMEHEHELALRRREQLVELRKKEEEELRLELEHTRMQAEIQQEKLAVADLARQQVIADREQSLEEECGRVAKRLENLPLELLYDAGCSEDLAWRFGLPPSVLNSSGASASNIDLIHRLVQQQSFGKLVRVELPSLVSTRDALAVAERHELEIGDSLRISGRTERGGFLSLVNIGTSGRCWVQIPNRLVEPEATRVDPWEAVSLPDERLMPLGRERLDFVEGGPAGWEHIVAVVSKAPLFDLGFLEVEAKSATGPFYEIPADSILRHLGDQNVQHWDAGVLSFRVIERSLGAECRERDRAG